MHHAAPGVGNFLQFTFPANVRSARPGEGRLGKVRLFGLTCTPKQLQKRSMGTPAGKVNCRKPSADEDFVDVAGGGVWSVLP